MESTERFNCIFQQYPEYVQLSASRKEVLIPVTKELNKTQTKLKLEGRYTWMPKRVVRDGKNEIINFLFDTEKKNFVLANPVAAGTPKNLLINSQIVWSSGHGAEWRIRAIKDFLKEWFKPGIVRQLPEKIFTPSADLFIHIEYIFFFPFEVRESRLYQDYINHWYIRGKVFEDTLVELGVIADDSPKYLRGGYARYVNVASEEDRRLEVKIHFCKNQQRIS